jgi:hypothetical protein
LTLTDFSLASTVSDGRNTRGMTPVYRPLLNGVEFDITVSEATISGAEYQHDVVSMSCTSETLKDTTSLAGSAISFYWGLAPRTELFNGYINAVTDDQNATGSAALTFTMSILGATKEMQTGNPHYWGNYTIPQAVETLAYRGLLGSHHHDDPHVWLSLAQTDESDWKLACDLAKRLGWSIFSRYGVVMCYSPLRLFIENGSYIQLVASQYAATDFADYERALVDFTPIEDSESSYRNIGAKIAYFNGDTVQSAVQPGTGFTMYKYLSNLPVRNAEEAAIYCNIKQFSASSWKQQATARVLGNANIYPGMNVDIYTSNPKYYRDRYNGRWLVRGVQHHMDRQTFQTMLALARPDSTAAIQTAPYVPFWTQAGKARPNLTLFEGQWSSSWTDRRVRDIWTITTPMVRSPMGAIGNMP